MISSNQNDLQAESAAAGGMPQGDAAPSPTASAAAAAPAQGTSHEMLYFALRSKKVLVSIGILLVLIAIAIVGPILDTNDPNAYIGPHLKPPSAQFWFGTTTFGQDVFAQFANGLRATFFVGLLGGSLAALVGMTIGFIAGYRGGLVDEILMGVLTNVFLVIPTLAILIVITSYLQKSFPFIRGIPFESVFVGLTSWPWAARAIRAQTFSLTARDYVDLARLSGRSGWRIIVEEIAPNMSSYLFLTFILLFGGAILIAASLDFIGLGPTGGQSLGLMMFNAVTSAAMLYKAWWWFIPPGIGITATVASLYVMNVGLDEIFNPKLREM